MHPGFKKDLQFYKFSLYGFLKNLRFFEPFLYLFFLEQGLNFLQIGALITIREITRNVLEIPAGVLADSLGRRRIMVMAFSFYIISFFVFYISVSYGLFIVAMFCYSFGDAFRTGTHKAMIFTYLKNKN
jgi:MFS family permease